MLSETPLLGGWKLKADTLPDALRPQEKPAGFSLPGADALEAFADLIGGAQEPAAPQEEHSSASIPFSLPGALPEGVLGRAFLSREIDFGAYRGCHARLVIDHLCGSGSILLGDALLCRFGKGDPSIDADLTDALRLGRRQTLTICFDDAQEAGAYGGAFLRVTDSARFDVVRLKTDPVRRTLTAEIRIHAQKDGLCAVRAAVVPSPEPEASPWREARAALKAGSDNLLTLSFSLFAPCFQAGAAYDAPVLKLSLYTLSGENDRRGLLSDARTMTAGFPGSPPRAYVPLTVGECRLAPDTLIARAKAARVFALLVPAPVSALLCRRCTAEGIALLPYAPDGASPAPHVSDNPCVSPLTAADLQAFRAPSDALALWQLCGMIAFAPASQTDLTEEELLLSAAGRPLDPGEADGQTVRELRALKVRLLAEAARQGQYAGPLCAPGEWTQPMIADALRAAFEPMHVGVLPLRGAWWTQSYFSASLHVFIPAQERRGAYAVHAQLCSAQGDVLAELSRDCPVSGGPVGVLEGRLPEKAGLLMLKTTLRRSGAIVKQQELPVYVGERAPLETAFS